MGFPENDPNHGSSGPLGFRSGDNEECHDQDLIDWLAANSIRPPDWSIDPCIFDKLERQSMGEKNPFRLLGQSVVSGVYLFYSRSKDRPIALYVGKAANLWSRMQTHWCIPGDRGWINSYLEEINNGILDDVVMACAWKEDERAGVEARLIKVLNPRYCRRTE